MPFIETTREDIKALKGVHLFHFATSNCSQRVRLVLEEKGVNWNSHHVDLVKCENADPAFIQINPKGVVPVLVHDGKTIIESNDIIRYIDEHFEGPILSPANQADLVYLEESVVRSSGFQGALKLLSHEFLFKPVRRMNERQLEMYSEGTRNSELTEFMREFSSKEGFSHERIVSAVMESQEILDGLESRLASKRWLTGDDFGLTDISWVVNLHRLEQMHYPLGDYPHVEAWLQKMRARPAFAKAVSQFESGKMLMVFNIYSMLRRLQRTSVRHFVPG